MAALGISDGAAPESHLLVPVLPEPHHLIDDALQRGQQRGVQLPLHVHDAAAAPHGRRGSDGPRVGRRAGLLLPRVWVEGGGVETVSVSVSMVLASKAALTNHREERYGLISNLDLMKGAKLGNMRMAHP